MQLLLSCVFCTLDCNVKCSSASCYKKLLKQGNSLAVQWLGLGAFTATVGVQSLVGELRSHKPPGVAKKKIISGVELEDVLGAVVLASYENKNRKGLDPLPEEFHDSLHPS